MTSLGMMSVAAGRNELYPKSVHQVIPKVRLLGDGACHGLVVGVEVRIIVDFQRQRAERCSQLRGK
jgi:hypothetical protein